MITCTFMDNGDKKKCSEMMKNLQEQHAMGNDQCPKDLTAAVDAPQSHKWDAAHSDNKKQKAKQQRENNERNSNGEEKTDEQWSSTDDVCSTWCRSRVLSLLQWQRPHVTRLSKEGINGEERLDDQ